MPASDITAYALGRVLFHMSEDQQRRHGSNIGCGDGFRGSFLGRMQARQIVQALLDETRSEVEATWETMKRRSAAIPFSLDWRN